MNRHAVSLAFAALLLPVAALADAHSEIVNAETHAGLAAKGTDLAAVHMHLHHTLNCLVGPSGAGFDAKEINPCANAGSGAPMPQVRPRRRRWKPRPPRRARALPKPFSPRRSRTPPKLRRC